MLDGIGLAEALLGLPGVRVLDVSEDDYEVVVTVESTAMRAFCRVCGALARRRIGCRWMCVICRVSVGRRGWCGASGAGGAANASVRPGRGLRRRSISTRRR